MISAYRLFATLPLFFGLAVSGCYVEPGPAPAADRLHGLDPGLPLLVYRRADKRPA